jgi:hypothetical protein
MAQFNLNDYETVEDRLKRAHAAFPDLRVVTVNHTTPQDRQVSTWVVEARIYLTREDQLDNLVKATGWAFEVDGVNGMANKTSALENCETSAIGRALANMNLSGNKRTSREEMEKVARDVAPKPVPARDWMADVSRLADTDSARRLYLTAQKSQAPKDVLDAITAKAKTFG